jgi:hypothetical protein
MNGINSQNRRQPRRWITLGLCTAALLMGAVIVNAEKDYLMSFELMEGGVNHCQTPSDDGHHMCGAGMNSVFGHYMVMITLTGDNKGIIMYEFDKGGSITGNVQLKPLAKPGFSTVNVQFTKGTGRFKNISGRATGVMQCSCGELGVMPFVTRSEGTVGLAK